MNDYLNKIAQAAFQDELQTITNCKVPKLLPGMKNRTVSDLPDNDGADEMSSNPIEY